MTRRADQISPVRWLTPGAVEDSSAMWEDSMAAEGWGLYAEALMAEPQPSAPDGFLHAGRTPLSTAGQALSAICASASTPAFTPAGLEYDEAVTLFSEVVDFLPGSCAPGS